ncbi:MAG: hypothetical protein JXR59_11760 [Desulfuromonadaceae bacterium]|nr:hypothetical protein [Desulfuromonadaceae bacterium]
MNEALQAQSPYVRKMIIEKINNMSMASCALTVIEDLLRKHTDQAEIEDQAPNYYILDGLHYCMRCLADKMAADAGWIEREFGID